MAELVVDTKKIIDNIKKLNNFFEKHSIEWTFISKMLSGHKQTLEKLLNDKEIKKIHSIGDSRISSLETIKKIRPDIVTLYIKPPAIKYAKRIVDVADISLNTSIETIKALNIEANKLNKLHRIIIMIEMGELREGVVRENIFNFYKQVFELSNIEIIGIGTNLGCMYGIEPTYDKLIQLSLYKQLLETMFDRQLEVISGGSSITLPLIISKKIPSKVNHFRIGEAVFLGTTPYNNNKFLNLHTDAFNYNANILELEEKHYIPDGNIGNGNIGHANGIDEHKEYETTYKAIVDFGILDVDYTELKLKDDSIEFVGTTSDMTVYDIGNNKANNDIKYKVGSQIKFSPSYMGAARLMNSKFIEKKII